jgi:hypothetical protein
LAWLGHPNLEIIDNFSVKGFEEKLDKLLYKVGRCIGL